MFYTKEPGYMLDHVWFWPNLEGILRGSHDLQEPCRQGFRLPPAASSCSACQLKREETSCKAAATRSAHNLEVILGLWPILHSGLSSSISLQLSRWSVAGKKKKINSYRSRPMKPSFLNDRLRKSERCMQRFSGFTLKQHRCASYAVTERRINTSKSKEEHCVLHTHSSATLPGWVLWHNTSNWWVFSAQEDDNNKIFSLSWFLWLVWVSVITIMLLNNIETTEWSRRKGSILWFKYFKQWIFQPGVPSNGLESLCVKINEEKMRRTVSKDTYRAY